MFGVEVFLKPVYFFTFSSLHCLDLNCLTVFIKSLHTAFPVKVFYSHSAIESSIMTLPQRHFNCLTLQK